MMRARSVQFGCAAVLLPARRVAQPKTAAFRDIASVFSVPAGGFTDVHFFMFYTFALSSRARRGIDV
jgi:hypothetical protein